MIHTSSHHHSISLQMYWEWGGGYQKISQSYYISCISQKGNVRLRIISFVSLRFILNSVCILNIIGVEKCQTYEVPVNNIKEDSATGQMTGDVFVFFTN